MTGPGPRSRGGRRRLPRSLSPSDRGASRRLVRFNGWRFRGNVGSWQRVPTVEVSALLRHLHHVIDCLLYQVVRHVGAAALRGHEARAALEALHRVVVERVLTLGNA